jgi:hypothetical protein
MVMMDGECYDTSLLSYFFFVLVYAVFIETLMTITVSNSGINGQGRESS